MALIDKQPSCRKQHWKEEGAYFAGQLIRGYWIMDDLKSSVLQRPSDPAVPPA